MKRKKKLKVDGASTISKPLAGHLLIRLKPVLLFVNWMATNTIKYVLTSQMFLFLALKSRELMSYVRLITFTVNCFLHIQFCDISSVIKLFPSVHWNKILFNVSTNKWHENYMIKCCCNYRLNVCARDFHPSGWLCKAEYVKGQRSLFCTQVHLYLGGIIFISWNITSSCFLELSARPSSMWKSIRRTVYFLIAISLGPSRSVWLFCYCTKNSLVKIRSRFFMFVGKINRFHRGLRQFSKI